MAAVLDGINSFYLRTAGLVVSTTLTDLACQFVLMQKRSKLTRIAAKMPSQIPRLFALSLASGFFALGAGPYIGSKFQNPHTAKKVAIYAGNLVGIATGVWMDLHFFGVK